MALREIAIFRASSRNHTGAAISGTVQPSLVARTHRKRWGGLAFVRLDDAFAHIVSEMSNKNLK